jgi:hypothetical protein
MSPIKSKILKFMAGGAAAVGLYLFGLAIHFLYGYTTDTTSTVRHEYLEGVALSLLISLPFWVLVSCFIFPIRSGFSKGVFWIFNAPAILLLSSYGMVNVYVLFQALG